MSHRIIYPKYPTSRLRVSTLASKKNEGNNWFRCGGKNYISELGFGGLFSGKKVRQIKNTARCYYHERKDLIIVSPFKAYFSSIGFKRCLRSKFSYLKNSGSFKDII